MKGTTDRTDDISYDTDDAIMPVSFLILAGFFKRLIQRFSHLLSR